jgi:N-acetylglucosamine-6-phosphate deacetylase
LGNGCPRELERHDNIIQRALSLSDRLWCSLIVDGVHVPYFVLKNWLRCIGYDRAIVVSDAIAAAGMGAGTYSLAGLEVAVAPSGATRLAGQPGYLAGSTTTLAQAARNLQTGLGIDAAAIRQLTAENPRHLLGR